jgi:hypothetical protein
MKKSDRWRQTSRLSILNSKVCRRSWINYGPVSTEKSTAVILLLRPNEPGLKPQNEKCVSQAEKEYKSAEKRRKKELSDAEKRIKDVGKRIKKAEDSKEKRIEDLEKERRKREEEARKE